MRTFDDNSSGQRPFISTGSELGPCTLPGTAIQVLVSCCIYPSSWPLLLPSRDSERFLSAIQPSSWLGQLLGFIPKFPQHLCQNSIQIKKWPSAFFPKPHTSVADSSLDTKYQEDHFFTGVLWPMSRPGWFLGVSGLYCTRAPLLSVAVAGVCRELHAWDTTLSTHCDC